MTDDIRLSSIASELEDEGFLGLAAGAILVAFRAGSEPGLYQSTSKGFVWTKSIEFDDVFDVPIGIGRLQFPASRIECTTGIRFDDEGGVSHADLILRMVGDDASVSPLSITLNEKYVQRATAKTRAGGEIFGYDKATSEPATFALPSIPALEISFRRGPADELLGAATLHQRPHSAAGTGGGLTSIASGIINLSLDGKVLVFPEFGDFGLSLESLFLDLSDSNAISTASMFPEVYVPSWKGIGGQRLGFYYPVSADEDEDEEWIAAELDGFLIGFDGLFSARGEIDYTSENEDHYVRRLNGAIDIRNNEPVQGELEAAVSVKRVNRSIQERANGEGGDQFDEDQQNLADAFNDESNAANSEAGSDRGVLLCRMQLVRFKPPGEPEWIGVDITVRGYAQNMEDTQPILSFNGPSTKWLPPILLGALGIAGLIGSIVSDADDAAAENKKATDILTFSGLILISIADLISKASAPDSGEVLPTITQFDIRKLGCRLLFQSEDSTTGLESAVFFHLLTDVGIEVTFDASPTSMIDRLLTIGLGVVDSPAKLFGNTFTQVNIKGPLKLEVNNLSVGLESRGSDTTFSTGIPPAGRVDLDSSTMKVTATQLPDIDLEPQPGDGDSDSRVPMPLIDAYPIIKKVDGKTALGFAIGVRGAESPDFKLETPTFGIALYLLPKASISFETTLLSEPRIRLAVPPTLMIDGAVEIDKPIPSFDGRQSRVSVDVGIFSSSVANEEELDKENLETLYDIGNYKYQFGGTYAWGVANESSPSDRFSFNFAAVRFDSSTPFCTIGPIGIFGLSGLFGKNIEPGSTGDSRDAMGIARWIQSTPSSFESVTDWPAVPPRPETWHPARDMVGDRDYYVGGLRIRAGSPTDNGDTYELEVLLMAGFVDFWIAIAGNALLKSINAKLTVVFVYDRPSRSGYFKAVFQFKIDKAQSGNPSSGGKIFDITVPLEVGGTPNATWIYLGHYADEKGGPISAKLLGGLLNPQAYVVFDTRGLTDFGLRLETLAPADADLDGPAFGHGTMVEFGPKRYGPSAINVSLHAGIGYNFGLKAKPFLLVGDLFLGGSIELKVFFIKLGLSLYALLTGRLTSDFFVFEGELQVKVNLPWPLPDLKCNVPFGFSIGDDTGVPAPLISMQSAALRRMESEAITFTRAASVDEMPTVPIDGVVALSFDKPIREIIETADTHTRLVITDTIATDSLDLVESIQTTVNDRIFNIEYTHDLTDIRIECRPVTGGGVEVIEEIAATWDVPVTIDDSGSIDDAQQAHHAVYFNTLTIPEMDYFNERLDRTAKARETEAALPPCKKKKHVCMLSSAPTLTSNPDGSRRTLTRVSEIGAFVLTEMRVLSNLSTLVVGNRSRLSWTAGQIQLPHETQIRMPIAQRVNLRLRFNTRFSSSLNGLLVRLEIPDAAGESPTLASLHIAPERTPCNLTAHLDVLPGSAAPLSMSANILDCSQAGEIEVEIEVKTPEPDRPIDRMTIIGPIVLFKDVVQRETNEALSKILSIINADMYLRELCVDTASATPQAWQLNCLTCDERGNSATGDEAVGNFWANQLLKPDHIYTISYRIRSNGRTMARDDEALEPDQSKVFDMSSGLAADDELRTLQFRTESAPSQNIKKYLGFAFPNTGMQPVYPTRTLPLISFKHSGLIKAIYREHHGAHSLQVRLADIDGNAVPRRLTATIPLQSAPSDALLDALVDACLPEAVGFSELEIDIFSRDLETDTRYALSVRDSTAPEQDLPPIREVFSTSSYIDLGEHVKAVVASIVDAVTIPLLDLDRAPDTMREIFAHVQANNLSGHDALIETLYRRLLGVESGRLFESLELRPVSAAQLVGRDPLTDELISLGIAIEMREPLITKEGVSLATEVVNAMTERGIRRINAAGQTLHMIHDRSGSRLLFLNSANLIDFQPIHSPVDIGFTYSGEAALRDVVEQYENATFANKPAAAQQLAIDNAMAVIAGLSGVGDALASDTASARLLPVSTL